MKNKNIENNDIKKPKFYIIARIIGFSMLAIGITLIVLSFTIGDANHGGIAALTAFGFLMTFSCPMLILLSFTPEINKLSIKNARYVQNETKAERTAIAETEAEIHKGAIKTTAQAVKEGLKDTKFCKYCGEQIDTDSVYCNKCRKQQ